MHAHGVGHSEALGHWAHRAGRPSGEAEETSDPAQPDTAPEPTGGDEAEAQDAPKGVLRLLMAGHFKGVADVRLRINFADQLPEGLPPPSAPTGNGVAYAKFMAIYSDLQATAPAPESPETGTPEETPPPDATDETPQESPPPEESPAPDAGSEETAA